MESKASPTGSSERTHVALHCGRVWRASSLVAAVIALALAPGSASAARAAWNAERVSALADQMIEQGEALEKALREAESRARAATEDPDREADVGGRYLIIQDLSHPRSRALSYRDAVHSGQGREETRTLFNRIDSLMSLAAGSMRNLPDYASYRERFTALQQTIAAIGRFYAEHIDVESTPPDPLKELEKERERQR